ncbi:hypothetical protein R3W88_015528 [Solanum pinnatisectum]|uniref:HMA domain-containing protein n=1 Tax=Solanum pinnatisectum TaxID=50273 RepID=A0AAV9KUR0_9SOLN|nr:hypothetical protein R3W88_015528 [Solanum pinnatisectum]
MAYSLVYPNTFALNLKIHCKTCEKKLKNMLLKVQGVHSLKIDAKLGNIVISGIVDPATIITMLEKHGRRAQLLWEQGIPIKDNPVDKASRVHSRFEEGHNSKNVQIITQSNKVINPLNDPDITNQLEELSRIPGLQTMEVTKTIKLTFQAEPRNEPNDKIQTFCTAINHSHNHHGCCCDYDCPPQIENWDRARPFNCQPLPMTPLPPPTAPPLPFEYFQAPPPSSSSMPHTYYSVLSDENVNGCIIL